MMRVARAQLFPHSGEGGKEHENRAGDKLAELAEAVGLMDGIPKGSAFLDLCGGPGAWSQYFLEDSSLDLKGFGFTLRTLSSEPGSEDWKAEDKDQWYPDLERHPRWRALWGADGTGDLLKLGNIEDATNRLSKEKVMLVAADGGFSDSAIPANQLELYFYRLFLGEVLMAASCLKEGGRFVCKLYSSFGAATSALLYLTTRVFDNVRVVKPKTSRVAGIERYLVASGFRSGPEVAAVRSALESSHAMSGGIMDRPLLTPIVSQEQLRRDEGFVSGLRVMVKTLCERQTGAISAVCQRAEYLEDVALEALSHSELADNEPRWAEERESRGRGRFGGRR